MTASFRLQKVAKLTIFGIFDKLLSTQNVSVKYCWMRLFLWFSTTVENSIWRGILPSVNTAKSCVLCIFPTSISHSQTWRKSQHFRGFQTTESSPEIVPSKIHFSLNVCHIGSFWSLLFPSRKTGDEPYFLWFHIFYSILT